MDNYFKLFGTCPDDIRKLLGAALSKGGEYADVFFEYTISNSLSLRDSQVSAVRSDIDFGVGIRVIYKEKTGYAFSEKTDFASMMKAALTAAEIASSPGVRNIPECVAAAVENRYPIENPWDSYGIGMKKERLMQLDTLIRSSDKRTVNVIGSLNDSDTAILFCNSAGEMFHDRRPMAALSSVCIMAHNGRTENSYHSRSFRQGSEFLTDSLIAGIAESCVGKCSLMFEADRPPCGEMPVVMGSGSSGILLHEAIGHAFEADFNRKGISIFADRMGKRICSPDINIIDDGTIPFNRGAVNMDDEGTPGQKTYMVTGGILTSYLHDRISAAHYGVAPTGNGRRESFRFLPIPRMRSTYMESGKNKEEDLIRSVRKGIYVDNFSNGQVQIGAGDFTFYVKSGYLIENGRLTRPVKDANIIGNGPEALAAITAVADNLEIDDSTWTCGKGQYCPVSCGMPSVLVSKLNVGGING